MLIDSFGCDRSRVGLAFFNAPGAKLLHHKYSEIAANRSYISVRFFEHTWPQPSVIARIEGTGMSCSRPARARHPLAHRKLLTLTLVCYSLVSGGTCRRER
jgi:hypothetical protein